MIITHKEYIDGLLKHEEWKFQAWRAFCEMNRIRDIYHKFSRDKKVKASHFFYDCIFRCSESPHYSGFMSDDARYVEKPTVDHPFSARVAARAIFEDHQYLLDDFELFCSIFEMLLQTLKMTSDENQLVKIKKDGFGGVIVDKVIEERYGGITWYGKDSIVKEFPLKQPPFYQKYEMKIKQKVEDAGGINEYKNQLKLKNYEGSSLLNFV